MNTALPTTLSVELQFAQAPKPAAEAPVCTCTEALSKDILADEHLFSEVIANLKMLLSEEQLANIEDMPESGNELPIAAMFAPDSDLLKLDLANIPTTVLEIAKLDGHMVSSFAASVQKLGDNLAKRGTDAVGHTLETIGRQISEAVSAGSDGTNGSGKQIQDMLAIVKAELQTTDVIPKTLVSVAGEGAATSIPNVNSAIGGLAQQTVFQTSAGSQLPPPIAAQLGGNGWSEAMGERIMWMMGKGIQAASIRITPPHLGPIQVQLSVQNDQASVNMITQHGVVKEALEAAMPRLREMLAESNLQLVNVDVSHRENMQHGNRSESPYHDQVQQAEDLPAEQEEITAIEDEVAGYYTSSGLLDDYA